MAVCVLNLSVDLSVFELSVFALPVFVLSAFTLPVLALSVYEELRFTEAPPAASSWRGPWWKGRTG
jgi:hypothetical protein